MFKLDRARMEAALHVAIPTLPRWAETRSDQGKWLNSGVFERIAYGAVAFSYQVLTNKIRLSPMLLPSLAGLTSFSGWPLSRTGFFKSAEPP